MGARGIRHGPFYAAQHPGALALSPNRCALPLGLFAFRAFHTEYAGIAEIKLRIGLHPPSQVQKPVSP